MLCLSFLVKKKLTIKQLLIWKLHSLSPLELQDNETQCWAEFYWLIVFVFFFYILWDLPLVIPFHYWQLLIRVDEVDSHIIDASTLPNYKSTS